MGSPTRSSWQLQRPAQSLPPALGSLSERFLFASFVSHSDFLPPWLGRGKQKGAFLGLLAELSAVGLDEMVLAPPQPDALSWGERLGGDKGAARQSQAGGPERALLLSSQPQHQAGAGVVSPIRGRPQPHLRACVRQDGRGGPGRRRRWQHRPGSWASWGAQREPPRFAQCRRLGSKLQQTPAGTILTPIPATRGPQQRG